MIEASLLSVLGGALTRLLTWGSEYFTKRQENTHELALLEKQMELERQRALQKQDELALQGEISIENTWAEALKASITNDRAPVGTSLAEKAAALVRPFLAYYWCVFLYTVHKGVLIATGIQQDLPLFEFSKFVLTDFDLMVVGSIIGYYYVDRRLRTVSGGK